MFPFYWRNSFNNLVACVLLTITVISATSPGKTRNRGGKQFDYGIFVNENPTSAPPPGTYQYSHGGVGGNGDGGGGGEEGSASLQINSSGSSPLTGTLTYSSPDGYQPGPPPFPFGGSPPNSQVNHFESNPPQNPPPPLAQQPPFIPNQSQGFYQQPPPGNQQPPFIANPPPGFHQQQPLPGNQQQPLPGNQQQPFLPNPHPGFNLQPPPGNQQPPFIPNPPQGFHLQQPAPGNPQSPILGNGNSQEHNQPPLGGISSASSQAYYQDPPQFGNGFSLPSNGFLPGKPPPHLYENYQPYPFSGGSTATASASSFSGPIYGWPQAPPPPPPSQNGWPRPPPPQTHNPNFWRPPPPLPTTQKPIFSWAPPPAPLPQKPSESLQNFGWEPAPPPGPEFPPRPVPEFNYEFSLKPSAFGWETSYNVPCGNYKIQPRVIAHLRLATQAVLPKEHTESKSSFPLKEHQDKLEGGDRKRKKRANAFDEETSLPLFHSPTFDEFEQRSLHYSPYHPQQFTPPRPTFKPRTCRWNFSAVGGCVLNFKCSWFQLPALFSCNENYLHVTDSTILLDSKFCGNRRPRRVYTSSSGKLTFTFKSEGAALPAVFDCTVICTPPEGPQVTDFIKPSPTSPNDDLVSTNQPYASPGTIVVHHHHHHAPAGLIHQQPLVSASSQSTSSVLSPNNRRNSTAVVINQTQKNKQKTERAQLRMGNCKCGVPDSHYSSTTVHGRIVGGSSMIPGESPWTAALVKKNSNRPYCGATLINNIFLLSAAHCVLNQTRKIRIVNIADTLNTTNNESLLVERIYFDVLLNEHDISQPNEIAGGTIRAKVDSVIIHPKYNNVTFNFDAALIRLTEPVQFNPQPDSSKQAQQEQSSSSTPPPIQHRHSQAISTQALPGTGTQTVKGQSGVHPYYYNTFDFHSLKRKKRLIPEIEARAIPPKPVPVCLPEVSGKSETRNGKNVLGALTEDYALVTGWGLVTEGGVPSNEMLKARVQIFNDTMCQDLYKKHNYVITDSMLCAGYINGNIDSCVGDSGSPLVMEEKDRFVLAGLVSWGRGCGRKQLPGVYTRVSEIMDWIYEEATDQDAIWCS